MVDFFWYQQDLKDSLRNFHLEEADDKAVKLHERSLN